MKPKLPVDFTDKDASFLMMKIGSLPNVRNLSKSEAERVLAIARRMQRLADMEKQQ